jgi:hypothetical protein
MDRSTDQVRAAIDALLDRVGEQLRRELGDLVRAVGDASADRQAEAARHARTAAEEAANAFAAEAIGAERAAAARRQQAAVEAALEDARGEHERALAATTAALEATHASVLADAAACMDAAVASAHAAERTAELATASALLDAVRLLDDARSLSAVLDGLVARAGSFAPRVAVLVVRGGTLRGWGWQGFDRAAGPASSLSLAPADPGIVPEVVRTGTLQTLDGPAPDGALLGPLGPDRAAVAIPLRVDDHVVGVLYADDDAAGERQVPSAWPELLEILARHAGHCLEATTARRLPDLVRASAEQRQRLQSLQQDDEAAQRYARLLVAEIKLYHESVVEEGRQAGDLLRRLRPQIERAHQLYDERVPAGIRAHSAYFEDELVRTLADGDAALLGQAT